MTLHNCQNLSLAVPVDGGVTSMMSEPKVFFLVPLSSNDTFPPGHLGSGEQQSYVEIPRAGPFFVRLGGRLDKSTLPAERWPRISGWVFGEMTICL